MNTTGTKAIVEATPAGILLKPVTAVIFTKAKCSGFDRGIGSPSPPRNKGPK